MNANHAEQQANQALESIEGLQPAGANPFLYTRIQQRLINRRQTQVYGNKMFRLALVLLVCIVVNVFTYVRMQYSPAAAAGNTNIEAFASDYGLNEREENL